MKKMNGYQIVNVLTMVGLLCLLLYFYWGWPGKLVSLGLVIAGAVVLMIVNWVSWYLGYREEFDVDAKRNRRCIEQAVLYLIIGILVYARIALYVQMGDKWSFVYLVGLLIYNMVTKYYSDMEKSGRL